LTQHESENTENTNAASNPPTNPPPSHYTPSPASDPPPVIERSSVIKPSPPLAPPPRVAPPPDEPAVKNDDDASRWSLGLLLLTVLAVATAMIGLESGPPLGDHDCINPLAAREILASGEWLMPTVSDVPWVRKTPLGAWLIAGAAWLIEGPTATVSQYSARLPSALAAFGTVMLVYWLGRQMYDRRAGVVCGFITAVSAGMIFYARSGQVDMVLTFFTTLSFACFWRGAMHQSPSRPAMLGFYAAFAMAMMAKAPLPLVTVGLAIAVFWFITNPIAQRSTRRIDLASYTNDANNTKRGSANPFRRLGDLSLVPGIIIFIVLAGAWPVYVYLNYDNALALWKSEYLDRFTGAMSDRSRPPYYYIPILFLFTAPYLLSLPEAILAPFLPRYRSQRRGLTFAWTWLIIGAVFLSASSFKRPHYVVSLLPACCLLLGPVIDRLFFGAVNVGYWGVRVACRIIPIALAAGMIAGGVVVYREFPDLLRSYALAIAAAFGLWTAASVAFARDRRTLSFAQLNAGVLILLILIWPGLGSGLGLNAESNALAAELRAHNVETDDLIYWVDDRPDASVEFYHDFHVLRLIDELEMTELRKDRTSASTDMYFLFAKRIGEALTGPEKAYLILKGENLSMLRDSTSHKFDVLFTLDGYHKDPGDELAVITQESTTGSQKPD